MPGFLQNLRHGLRLLRKAPGFTIVAVVTLALGIGANTAIFSVVYATLIEPLPYPNSSQLVMLWSRVREHRNTTAVGDFLDWKRQNSSFQDLGAFSSSTFNLATNDRPEQIEAGRNSLLAWLDEALAAQPEGKAPDILLIQIRSFPSEAASPEPKSRGWSYQAYAPGSALMQVRTTGQLVRDQEAIELFRKRWAANGVRIRLATFEFPGNDAPLSWKMSPRQMQAISEEWKKRISGEHNQDWIQTECFFLPAHPDCNKLGSPLNKGPW